jgi:ribosome-associated protein
MDIRKLQRVIVDGLEDVKALNIVVFNTEHLSSLFERVIIASGTSNRQTRSLASSVREAVKKAGFPVPRLEGEDNGEWIIVDCGAAVAHVMQPAIRDYYHLEEIWGDKPVKMKIDGVATKLVKASEPERERRRSSATPKPAAGKETAAKRAALGKAPAKAPTKAPAKKAAAKTSPRSAPSRAPARPAAKKVAAKPGVTRVVGVKKAATSSRSAKSPAKKAPARKTAARG